MLAADFLSQFCLVGSMTLPTNSGTSFTLSLMMKRKGLSTWSSAVLMNAERGTNSMPVAKDISYNARPIHLRKRGPLLPLQKSYMKAVRQHASHSSGDWLPTTCLNQPEIEAALHLFRSSVCWRFVDKNRERSGINWSCKQRNLVNFGCI